MPDWLDELYNIRREDEERESKKDIPLDLSVLRQRDQAISVMRVIEAHKILRRVNDALLKGKGLVKEVQDSQYDQTLALIWQGPVSKARPPRADDPADCSFIWVAAKGKEVFVNHKPLPNISPEAFKAALVQAAKEPIEQAC